MTKAERRVQETYATFKEHQKQGPEYFKDFVKACREAHAQDVSDERLSILIDKGYSRSSIQQFRKGKMRKVFNCG